MQNADWKNHIQVFTGCLSSVHLQYVAAFPQFNFFRISLPFFISSPKQVQHFPDYILQYLGWKFKLKKTLPRNTLQNTH